MIGIACIIMYIELSGCLFFQKGVASWYGRENIRSCSGKMLQHTSYPAAAHKTLPLGSKVKVIDIKTNKSVIVVIEDRGPYYKNRVIDLNIAAAKELNLINRGTSVVSLHLIE